MSDAFGKYPAAETIHYGVPVWSLGEDGETYLAGGHGRRAAAALSAYARSEMGVGWRVAGSALTEKWAVFYEGCGCTAEQHAEHVAEADRDDEDLVEVCEKHGCNSVHMPPCETEGPMYAWWADYSSGLEPTPGALPVTLVDVP